VSRTTSGVIAAGHNATAEAGAEMLRQGGNAFDAVVAAAFASFVSEFTLTSAGGGGFLTAYRRKTGESTLLDFFVNMPGFGRPVSTCRDSFFPVHVNFGSIHQEFHIGPASIAVPGNLSGLFKLHQDYGELPIGNVLSPAIRFARDGIIVNRHQAFFIALLKPILTLTEEGRRIAAPGGTLLGEGDRLFMKDFARTLECVAEEGPAGFYDGAHAAETVQALEGEGGLLTLKDLEKYSVEVREPITFDYRGFTILTNPPPSSGGCLISLCLKVLEGISFSPQDFLSSQALNAQVAATQLTNSLRTVEYDQRIHHDAAVVPELLNDEQINKYQKRLLKILDGTSSCLDLMNPEKGIGNTTQISVIDENGNAASLTTSNGEGSGVYIPGTGIMLNNMLGEEDINPAGFHDHQPGRRISSMMSPTILLKGREPVAVLGSGGSNRIRSAILQAVCNLIDFKRDATDAVNVPRIHWERGTLNIEPGIRVPIAPHLCAPEHRIYWKETNMFFGGVHAVTRDPETGAFDGAGDHRRGGVSVVVE
jgi:gamma-glutamyltranspeptidase/glutathione hydrolase